MSINCVRRLNIKKFKRNFSSIKYNHFIVIISLESEQYVLSIVLFISIAPKYPSIYKIPKFNYLLRRFEFKQAAKLFSETLQILLNN